VERRTGSNQDFRGKDESTTQRKAGNVAALCKMKHMNITTLTLAPVKDLLVILSECVDISLQSFKCFDTCYLI